MHFDLARPDQTGHLLVCTVCETSVEMEMQPKAARGGKRSRASGGMAVVLLEKKESEKERRKRMKALCEKLSSLITKEHFPHAVMKEHTSLHMLACSLFSYIVD